MSFQKTHDNYRNGDCIHKNSCRYILKALLDEVGIIHLSSITLPSTNFILERDLVNKYRSYFLRLFEINPQVYKEQLRLITGELCQLNLHNMDVFSYTSKLTSNFIWLDLCNYFTQKVYMDLLKFLSYNPLNKRGVFSITLLSSRENKETQQFFKRLQKTVLGTEFKSLTNFRNEQLPLILAEALHEYANVDVKLETRYSYKPTSGGGVMTMYAFTWSKIS